MYFMTDIIMASVSQQIKMIENEKKMFELSIADLDENGKKAAREKRRIEQREDRKHRELCQAIRDSKPAQSPSLATALFGGIILGSIID